MACSIPRCRFLAQHQYLIDRSGLLSGALICEASRTCGASSFECVAGNVVSYVVFRRQHGHYRRTPVSGSQSHTIVRSDDLGAHTRVWASLRRLRVSVVAVVVVVGGGGGGGGCTASLVILIDE